MARKPDTPCADCGKPMWGGKTSLPPGLRRCHSCRRANPARSATRATGDCKVCGAVAFGQRLTCSPACAAAARALGKRPCTMRTCQICGAPFSYTYSKQRTCGRICGAKLNVSERQPRPLKVPPPPRPPTSKTCQLCRAQFTGPRRSYCSATCASTALRVQGLKRYGKTVEDVDRCGSCGAQVAFKRRTCDECKAATLRAVRRRRRRKERARQRGITHEPYTLAEIASRDHGMCGLCRKRVAMRQVVPHPKAPTIDHILPIAAGGQDTRANVQLAHFMCNSLKGAGGTQQLVLFG